MKCIHCGQEIREGAKFCLYCGKPQIMPEVEELTAPTVMQSVEEQAQQPTVPVIPPVQPQQPYYQQPQQPLQFQQPQQGAYRNQQGVQPQQGWQSPQGAQNMQQPQQPYFQNGINPYVPMEEEEEESGSSNKAVKILAIAVGVLAVIALIVVGLLFFWNRGNDDQPQNTHVSREEDDGDKEDRKDRDKEEADAETSFAADAAKGDSLEAAAQETSEESTASETSEASEASANADPAAETSNAASTEAETSANTETSSESTEASSEVVEESAALPPLSAELLSAPLYGMTKLSPNDIDCSMEFIRPEEDYYFPVDYLIDGDIYTNWQVYNDNGEPVGEWAKLIFDQEVELTYFELWLGYATSEWGYYANSRPKELIITFGNGESITVEFADARDWQYLQLSRPVKTDSVTFTIKSLYVGNEWTDNAISEIMCYGNR